MSNIGIIVPRVNQDVINVGDDAEIQEISEDSVYEGLKNQ